MNGTRAIYRNRGSTEPQARIIMVLPKQEVDAIDAWGGPAGMPSRTSAVRHLIQKGLEAIGQSKPATGQGS